MSFRKEKKFRLSKSDLATFKHQLLKHGMQELHPPRQVNSCYFDSRTLQLFHESEEGVLPRKKIRLRWYNNSTNLEKETKISSIEGRYKHTEPSNIHDLLCARLYDHDYGVLLPTLIVSYQREYFSYRSMRITFDQNIQYRYLQSVSRFDQHDQESVMEVKVAADCPDDYIESIIQLPTSRFSKYSRGVLLSGRHA